MAAAGAIMNRRPAGPVEYPPLVKQQRRRFRP
jgi:hypothetical protein